MVSSLEVFGWIIIFILLLILNFILYFLTIIAEYITAHILKNKYYLNGIIAYILISNFISLFLLNIVFLLSGSLIFYAITKLAIFIIEFFLLKFLMTTKDTKLAIIYVVITNLLSILLFIFSLSIVIAIFS